LQPRASDAKSDAVGSKMVAFMYSSHPSKHG
jgi:hypothetical protein